MGADKKIGFTGDLVLQEVKKAPEVIFKKFTNKIQSNKIKLCVNLENPLILEGMQAIKNKTVLCAYEEQVKYLNFLSPYLVNLSNNHINDFGNRACEYTFEILKKNQLNYFGASYHTEFNYSFIDKEIKVVFLAYTTRSSDFTGSELFARENFIGVFEPDFEQINLYRNKYPEYKIVVNIHWGIEDIKFPEVEKRKLGYKLIDSGVDLIIGHHPHIIQPYELYKGKYIFYSLGNFYFNDITVEKNGKMVTRKMPEHRKIGLVPIFKFNNKNQFVIDNLLKVHIVDDSLEVEENITIKRLSRLNILYLIFFPLYYKTRILLRKSLTIIRDPKIILIKFQLFNNA